MAALETTPSHLAPDAANAKVHPLAVHSLRCEAITIGPVLPQDTGALFSWLNDVDAAKGDHSFRPIDWVSFDAWMLAFTKNTDVLFAIRRVSEAPIIGYVMLKNIHPVHRSAELGIRIGDSAERDKGFGRKAIALALAYAWNQLNLNRVELSVLASNTRAIRAYTAAGFEIEGVRRQSAFIDGQWVDQVIMATLRSSRV